jgi:hypothetical protein
LGKLQRQLTPELLAKNLRRYKLKSEQITMNGKQVRGSYCTKLKPIVHQLAPVKDSRAFSLPVQPVQKSQKLHRYPIARQSAYYSVIV